MHLPRMPGTSLASLGGYRRKLSAGRGGPVPPALPGRWHLRWFHQRRCSLVIGTGALAFLAVLGAIGAKAGGAPLLKPALGVTFLGALAMAATTGIGRLFGTIT